MTFDVMVPRNGQKLADTHFQTIKEFQMWKYLVQLLPGHLSRDYKLLSPSSRWDDDQAERQTRNLVCILLLRQAQHSFYWWAWYLLHTLSDTAQAHSSPDLSHCTDSQNWLYISHIVETGHTVSNTQIILLSNTNKQQTAVFFLPTFLSNSVEV